MAKELADARLLTHDGYGHTALFNNASSCVKTYESRYFVDGTLPPPGPPADRTSSPSPERSGPGLTDALGVPGTSGRARAVHHGVEATVSDRFPRMRP